MRIVLLLALLSFSCKNSEERVSQLLDAGPDYIDLIQIPEPTDADRKDCDPDQHGWCCKHYDKALNLILEREEEILRGPSDALIGQKLEGLNAFRQFFRQRRESCHRSDKL